MKSLENTLLRFLILGMMIEESASLFFNRDVMEAIVSVMPEPGSSRCSA